LTPQEPIMMVATASKHRKDAFEAADFLMDFLKSRAPFWKKEQTDASNEWVASMQDDEDALKRW
jgi:molybdopterin synthase catalytic subunit